MAARRTQLGRWKVPIQWKIASSIPFRLVLQFTEYFTECRINDVLGKIVILRHPGHVQSFDKDRLVLADDLRREFLNRVSSGVADFGVLPRHPQSGLLPIVAVLDLARQAALKSLQSLFPSEERTRVLKFLAFTGR